MTKIHEKNLFESIAFDQVNPRRTKLAKTHDRKVKRIENKYTLSNILKTEIACKPWKPQFKTQYFAP